MVQVWNEKTGTCLTGLKVSGFDHSLCFHLSRFSVGVATSDDKVKVYDARPRMKNLQQVYSAHEGTVSQVAFYPSDNYHASPSMGGIIKLYDLLEARPIFTLHSHEKAVEFSLKGEFFCSRGQNNQVMMWQASMDMQEGERQGAELLKGGTTRAGALDRHVLSEMMENVY